MREKWVTSPDLVSLSRIPLAALFLVIHNQTARVAILLVTALTDFLDGWLARRLSQTSHRGEIIDPVADKIFLTAALISLAVHGAVSIAGLLVLLARDVVTIVAFFVVIARHLHVRLKSRFPGKVVTSLQLATVLVLTLSPMVRSHNRPNTGNYHVASYCVWLVGAATIWALVDYISFGIHSLRARSQPR